MKTPLNFTSKGDIEDDDDHILIDRWCRHSLDKPEMQQIIRCVNAHDALVAACEDMLPLLVHAKACEASADDGFGHRLQSLHRRLDAARAALALAKGETDG